MLIYEALFEQSFLERGGKHTCKKVKLEAKWDFVWTPPASCQQKGRQTWTKEE